MSRFLSLCFLASLIFCVSPARAERIVEAAATLQDQRETPATADNDEPTALEMALDSEGFRLGAPAFIRIFKADSSLEVWMLKRGRFDLFRRFPICKWSGEIGPKLAEGDRQSPEGVYFITGGDLIVNRRWHRAMNIS